MGNGIVNSLLLTQITRRRPNRDEFFDGPSPRKRSRGNFDREPFYKDRRMDSRSPRYAGSYTDYMREFNQRPPPPHPMAQFGPPPGFFDGGFNPQFERAPRGGFPMGPGDFGGGGQRSGESSTKRSYERDVDDFLRRTSLSSKHRSREERRSDRDERGRERGRGRDRDREREHRSERDYDRRDQDRDRERERSSRHNRDRR